MGCAACARARRNAKRAASSVANGQFKQAATQTKLFAKNVAQGIKQNYITPKKR